MSSYESQNSFWVFFKNMWLQQSQLLKKSEKPQNGLWVICKIFWGEISNLLIDWTELKIMGEVKKFHPKLEAK